MSKFWKWAKAEASNELIIDGVIASESWFDDEISPKLFREELAKHSGAVTVRINSPGGDVFAGMAIYNALREHDGEVTVRVDGIAASAASFISMAGDKIIMLPGSMMMVHNSHTIAFGNAEDMSQTIEMLKKTDESMVSIYAARTGLSEERIRELLAAETYMTAEEAVELGFATEAVPAKSSFAEAMAKVKEYGEVINGATMQPAMALQAKLESDSEPGEEPTPAAPVEEESDDTDATPSATETADETPEAPVESETEETETTNSDEGNEEMSKQDDIATEGVQAAAPANPVTAAAFDMKAYLNKPEAMEAFAEILQANAGKSAKDVRAAWGEHLEVKAGVTNPEIFLPTPLITEIEDAFKTGGEIWSRVFKTGVDSFNAAWDNESDPSAEEGRAKGYNRATQEEKEEQELEFASRILRPQMVYKYIQLNKEDIKEQRSTGALVRFVLSELPRRIIREVERAIVVGDGRAANSPFKIQTGSPRGFYPIKADATAGNVFASVYTPAEGEDHYASIVRAADLLESEGTPVLITKKGFVTDIKLTQNEQGGYSFLGANMNDVLEVEAVLYPDFMKAEEDHDAYLVVLSDYRVVGDNSIEAYTNFKLETNKEQYLQELWAGGGLTRMKSAVAIAAVEAETGGDN